MNRHPKPHRRRENPSGPMITHTQTHISNGSRTKSDFYTCAQYIYFADGGDHIFRLSSSGEVREDFRGIADAIRAEVEGHSRSDRTE